MYHSLMLLAGMLALYLSSHLPGIAFILILICSVIVLWQTKRHYLRLLATLIFGYCWAASHAHFDQAKDLPDQVVGSPVSLSGCLIQVKDYSPHYQRLQLNVKQTRKYNEVVDFKGKVILSNYTPLNQSISAGWCGEWNAVLKPVHGVLNQRGFDFEAWAYVNNIKASGTLKSANNLTPGKQIENRYYQFKSKVFEALKQQLKDTRSLPLISSLAIGERSLLTTGQWSVLRRTGTSHLLAISGLHIGLVFWMVSTVGSVVWKLSGSLPLILASQKFGWLTGLCISGIYLALTGFPLSGRRAWIMLAIAVLVLFFSEQPDSKRCLARTLMIVLLIWPSSVLSLGFWFSFIAVSLILMQLTGVDINLKHSEIKVFKFRFFRSVYSVLIIQCVLSFAILPLSIVYFGELSFVSPVANFIAIPLISFLVLPFTLISLVLLLAGYSEFSQLLFVVPQYSLDWLYDFLNMLVELDWSWISPQINSPHGWIILLIGIFAWLYFRAWPGRWMLIMLVIPVLVNQGSELKAGEFEMTIFDVGQGLSVWLRTDHHELLIDTGYGVKNGFSYIDSVVIPVLMAAGVSKLSTAIISHEDSDHAGGLAALSKSKIMPDMIYGSLREKDSIYRYCSHGLNWQWDGVVFKFLTQNDQLSENDQSCVLKISSQFGSILLPGDIERKSEHELVKKYKNELKSDVLIAPHHGSNTSSTLEFLKHVNPERAIFSAGYLNRYQHPANKIVKRYQQRNIKQFNTACEGEITIRFRSDGIKVKALRKLNQPFWRHQCKGLNK